MNCYLCNSTKFISRPGEVRDNLNVHVVECKKCGKVFRDNYKLTRHMSRIKPCIQENKINILNAQTYVRQNYILSYFV